jgi:hypothetical protein
MPIWVNRSTRRRHVDSDCRGLRLSAEMSAEWEAYGSPGRDRIYELSDDESADVIAAVEAFTYPCRLCVPGARKLGELVPFYFVDEGYEDEDDEEDDESLTE